MINGKDPKNYLREHILKGDRSDGIPNIFSPDDTFITAKRQKPMRKVMLSELTEAMNKWEPENLFQLAKCPRDTWIRNWQRNETLIDLSKIPQDIMGEILKEYENVKVTGRDNLFNYFMKNRLNTLVENIGEF